MSETTEESRVMIQDRWLPIMEGGTTEEAARVMIQDRSVTCLPPELESTLVLQPCCVACKKTNAPTMQTCSSCKLVSYCCKECQAKDWQRHKTEDQCRDTQKLRRNLENAARDMVANNVMIIDQAIDMHGEDAFLGRDVRNYDWNDVIDLLAGRFMETPITQHYMERMVLLFGRVMDLAHRHNTRSLWEEALELAVEMKRLTHVQVVDMMDFVIPDLLLKLHRDDDAICFLLFWMGWRTKPLDELVDPTILDSSKGEWPFPRSNNGRFLDLTKHIRECEFQTGDISFPVSFCIIILAIKLRFICVYRKCKTLGEAFCQSAGGQSLPPDVGNHVASFLTGGRLGWKAHGVLAEQVTDLMDYIDEEYPHILPAVLDPSLLPPIQQDEEGAIIDEDQSFDVREYLEKYGNGPLIIETLVDMLKERRGNGETAEAAD